MKQFLTLCILSLFTQYGISQIFVNQNLTGGANDGSSWENAFTDLESAMSVSTPGQIWIAAGTYLPPTQSDGAYFQLNVPHALYGGFAGNEQSLEERDIALNETRLSGDLSQNDASTNVLLNKNDNALHVLYIPEMSAASIIIDGISFSNGFSPINDLEADGFIIQGAGILSYTTIHVSHCTFKENVGVNGSSIYLSPEAATSTIKNSVFTNNWSNNRSAGILIDQAEQVSIEDCEFTNSITNRGMVYPRWAHNTTIKNCLFENNVAENDFWSAGIFNWNSLNTQIDSCEFVKLASENGSAIYFDGRDTEGSGMLIGNITNSTFREITSRNRGALYFYRSDHTVDNCLITDCIGTGMYSTHCQFLVSNTDFIGNNARFGAGSSTQSSTANGKFLNCEFIENTSEVSGGGASTGFLAKVDFEDCVFERNHSSIEGGGLYVQNNGTTTSSKNCRFTDNTAGNLGGAVYIQEGSNNEFIACSFNRNEAGDPDDTTFSGFGGAISIGTDFIGLGHLLIDKCEFLSNKSYAVGGALYILNQDVTIRSSLFANNFVSGFGNGGAISQNALDGHSSETNIVNCTIANNEGTNIAGISQWIEDGDDVSTIHMNMTNTILFNPSGLDYAVAEGNPTISSLGGNMSLLTSLASVFNAEKDELGKDPLFVNMAISDFSLQDGSPAINTGVWLGGHESDLFGTPVVGAPDKGAIESEVLSATNDQDLFETYFEVLGNPINETIVLKVLKNIEAVSLQVLSQEAKLVSMTRRTLLGAESVVKIPLTDQASGIYLLSADVDGKRITYKIIKS